MSWKSKLPRSYFWTVDEIDVLKKTYSNLSKKEILKRINRTWSAILHKAHRVGLSRPTSVSRRLKLPEDKIVDLYANKKISAKKIAEKTGYSKPTILNRLREKGVKIRGPADYCKGKTPSNFMDIPREVLYNLYWSQKLPTEQIIKRLGISPKTLWNYLRRHNIPFRGYIMTDKIKKKISETLKIKSAFFKLNKNPAFQRKRLAALMERPTEIEKRFIEICSKNQMPFRYVGNGSLWIGNCNPDFVHTRNKVVVEIFGDYWHNPEKRNMAYNLTENGRKEFFEKHGWKCIVFWGSELKGEYEKVEKNILRRLKNYGVA